MLAMDVFDDDIALTEDLEKPTSLKNTVKTYERDWVT
jgi:hypothetical protein